MSLSDEIIRMNPENEFTRNDLNKIDPSSMRYFDLVAWDKMMAEPDAMWCTQSTGSLNRMIPYGRMRILEHFDEVDKKTNGALTKISNEINVVAKEKAQSITRDFDMSVIYQELVKKETFIEVPREVKKGLFRKETVIEKVKKETFAYQPKTVKFSGWKIAHFEKQYRFNDPLGGYTTFMNWDYCLGNNGELYHVSTSYTNWDSTNGANGPDYSCAIRRIIPFDNNVFSNKNQNLFIGITHGLLFALDDIPLDPIEPVTLTRGQEKCTFNFPLQFDGGEHLFQPGEGLLTRLDSL